MKSKSIKILLMGAAITSVTPDSHKYKERNHQNTERYYKGPQHRHHSHREFAKNDYPVTHLIGRRIAGSYIDYFFFGISRGTMSLRTTCRTS